MVYSRNNDGGFTLLEILIAMLISTIVLGIAGKTFIIQSKSYDIQRQITEMMQMGRAAINLMTREVRMAGYNTTNTPFDGIIYDPDQLQVFADLNGDGDTADAFENITYTYDSASFTINRDTGSGNQPLADNIQSFEFEYYNAAGTQATASSDIRKVQILITARTEKPDSDYAYNSGYRTYPLASMVKPRNIGY